MRFVSTLILSFLLSNNAFADSIPKDFEIVGYFANWSNISITSLPVQNLTIINYAFATTQKNGSIELTNPDKDESNFKAITELKAKNPQLKVVLSVGGWTLSKNFSDIAASSQSRQQFALSAKQLMLKYKELDGIDIDWEYPVSGGDNIPHKLEDKENYVLLVQEIRAQFNTLPNKHYWVTIASPHHNEQGDGGSINNLDVKAMLMYLDHINIMDYDFHQSTSEPKATNNDAALFQSPNNPSIYKGHDSIDESIQDFLDLGLSAKEMKQLVMGIPLYGFGWSGVSNNGLEANNPGLYASATGKLPNPYVAGSDGVFTYSDIINHLITDQKMQGSWNETYKFSTYYSESAKSFITFDDIQTTNAKAEYIKEKGLGGAMFWELSSDSFDDKSLVYNTCLALYGNQNSCVVPTKPTVAKMKLELTNNDPSNSITITLVTENQQYYAFSKITKNSSVTFDDKNSWNVEQLLGKSKVSVLLTTDSGQQRWCSSKLDMDSSSYHHIQVYYDNVPNCTIN
ncbi:MAG: glycoside hydrolase family 18 protein [Legionella sp.]|nr:glycoside hydrolase family 18 protein [Legionella sp.]